MAIQVKQSGVATGTAPLTLTRTPYATNASIYYVDSASTLGAASDSNTGLLEELPKATVFGASGALASATSGASTLIVCASTHRETVSSAYTFGAATVSIISKGSGSNRATFTNAVAGTMLATSTFALGRLENLVFAASTAATTSRLTVGAAGWEIRDCQFYCGASDTADCILVNASAEHLVIRGCTFTASVAGATRAVKLASATTTTNILVEDTTFDGGTAGWAGDAFSATAAVTGFRIRNVSLLRYSDMNLGTTGAKGYISGITTDNTSSWTWNP